MQKIDPALHSKLSSAPERIVALIVRTDSDPTPHLDRFSALGLKVQHKFGLLPGVSVTGTARAALSMVNEVWILRIEEDLPIATP